MPLDIWVARTRTFQAIHGPHIEGGLPPDELLVLLDELGGERRYGEWWFWHDGAPGWSAEPVLDVDATYLRLSVAMAAPSLESRLRGAMELAASVAERLDARAFEATAGRHLDGIPGERWFASRLREGERIRAQMEQNGLAPLEFPFRNLDAVNNFMTWVVEGDDDRVAGCHTQTGLRSQTRSNDGRTWVWNWSDAPFYTAWKAGMGLADDLAQTPHRLLFDGRVWDDSLAAAYRQAPGKLATEFYRWWVDARENWRNA